MMIKKRIAFNLTVGLLLVLLALGSCESSNHSNSPTDSPKHEEQVFNMTALTGTWIRHEEGKTSTEIWQSNGENKWKAESETIDSTGKVIFKELVLLEKRNDVWQYCVTSPDENDSREVCFSMVTNNPKTIRFENKAHDFPQAITYEWVDNNNLLAYIEGPDGEGGTMRIDFRFKRK